MRILIENAMKHFYVIVLDIKEKLYFKLFGRHFCSLLTYLSILQTVVKVTYFPANIHFSLSVVPLRND